MSEIMNVEAAAIAVRKNKKWFVGGSGGTTIHYYDSLDAVPADLPEGSFVAVPSEESAGGGGLPVVELTTPLSSAEETFLTADESEKLGAIINGGEPAVIKFSLIDQDGETQRISANGIIVNDTIIVDIILGTLFFGPFENNLWSVTVAMSMG